MSNRRDRTEQSDSSPRQERKERTDSGGGINIAGETDLGDIGGIDISGRARFGTEGLIPNQGITIERDVSNNTTKLGLGVGSSKGKLGGNVGVTIGYDEFGNQVVKEVELGINIAGFGGEIEIDDEGNVTTSISAGGAKIEVAIDSEGKKTVSVCYSIPGGEICVDFKPKDSESPTPSPSPTPTPTPTPTPNDSTPEPVEVPDTDVQGWVFVHVKSNSINLPYQGFASAFIKRKILSPIEERLGGYVGRAPMKLSSQVERITPNPTTFDEVIIEKNGVKLFVHQIPVYEPIAIRNPETGFFENKEIIRQNAASIYFTGVKLPLFFWGSFREIRNFLKINNEQNKKKKEIFPESYTEANYIPFACIPYYGPVDSLPPPPPPPAPYLPNKPNRIKKMKDCCKLVEEIHKYLGISKLKKNRFPVSNAFLAPGGSGNDNCFDYYSIIKLYSEC